MLLASRIVVPMALFAVSARGWARGRHRAPHGGHEHVDRGLSDLEGPPSLLRIAGSSPAASMSPVGRNRRTSQVPSGCSPAIEARLAVVSQWESARSSHVPGGPVQSKIGVSSSDMPVYISIG